MSNLIKKVYKTVHKKTDRLRNNLYSISAKLCIVVIGILVPFYYLSIQFINSEMLVNKQIATSFIYCLGILSISLLTLYVINGITSENDRSYVFGLHHGFGDLFQIMLILGLVEMVIYIYYSEITFSINYLSSFISLISRWQFFSFLVISGFSKVMSDSLRVVFNETHNFLEYPEYDEDYSNKSGPERFGMKFDPIPLDINPLIYSAITQVDRCIECSEKTSVNWKEYYSHLRLLNGYLTQINDIQSDPVYSDFVKMYSGIKIDMDSISTPSINHRNQWNNMKVALRDRLRDIGLFTKTYNSET